MGHDNRPGRTNRRATESWHQHHGHDAGGEEGNESSSANGSHGRKLVRALRKRECMAEICILTRGRTPGRTGPPSAWYEMGRNNSLAEELTRRGHRVAMWWDEPEGQCVSESCDLAVLRSGGPINIARGRTLRERGIQVVNDPDRHWAASDKWELAQLFTSHNIPHPFTSLADGTTDREMVLKVRRSSGGHGVSLIGAGVAVHDLNCVIQDKVALRDDLRALVMDGTVVHWLRRYPRAGEWRSNLAQGATFEEARSVSPALHELAVAAARAAGLDLCGVDLIQGDEGWYVLEVNPGTTLYGATVEEGVRNVAAIASALERRLPSSGR